MAAQTKTYKINNVENANACSGKAATADKLTAERTITLTGVANGNAKFDGSKDVSIATTAPAAGG